MRGPRKNYYIHLLWVSFVRDGNQNRLIPQKPWVIHNPHQEDTRPPPPPKRGPGPAVVPFYSLFLVGRVPLLKSTTETNRVPTSSKLSNLEDLENPKKKHIKTHGSCHTHSTRKAQTPLAQVWAREAFKLPDHVLSRVGGPRRRLPPRARGPRGGPLGVFVFSGCPNGVRCFCGQEGMTCLIRDPQWLTSYRWGFTSANYFPGGFLVQLHGQMGTMVVSGQLKTAHFRGFIFHTRITPVFVCEGRGPSAPKALTNIDPRRVFKLVSGVEAQKTENHWTGSR